MRAVLYTGCCILMVIFRQSLDPNQGNARRS